VTSAQLIGTAAGHAQVKRCTRGEALVEVERVLRDARDQAGQRPGA